MTIETATHVSDLNSSYPAAGDAKSEGDDHIRLIKTVIKTDVSTLSASASTTLSTVTAVSTVAANVSTSLGNVSTSLGNISTSLGNVSTSLGNVSTSNANVSTSNANVSTSLSATSSTLTAVSSTVATFAGSPAMVFVSEQTASASSAITFTGFASGYDYLVVADNIYTSGSANLRARVRVSSADDTSASYDWAGSVGKTDGTLAADYAVTQTYFDICATNNSSSTGNSFELKIYNPSVNSAWKTGSSNASTFNSGGYSVCTVHALVFRSNSAVDGITIYPASGTITAGSFKLYKIARA